MKKVRKSEGPQKPPSSQETVEELPELVQEHRVCWEVLPSQIPVKGDAPLKIGFNLMLYGTHAQGEHPIPGCEKCRMIYRDLRKIARWITPKVERKSRYEISPYDSAIGYSPERGNRPDVRLTIEILHRSEFDRPIDECEVLCLNEMKDKLSELGAQERRWRGKI